jgi:diguanylate cyclase (GGDEF)-like protein
MTPLEAAALLDAIPDATAVVTTDGTIVAVNRAWRAYTEHNTGDPETTGVGVNYIAVCRRSAAAGCADAAAVGEGLRAVLSGESVECDLEYPCPTPPANRWFQLRITQLSGSTTGALISHVNISRRKIAEQRLERKASEDPLTGLANRTTFSQQIAAALTLRSLRDVHADVGVLYIDLDGFKAVNDQHGHAAGDDVLLEVADRLRSVTRPRDTIARLGGDEFAVLMPRITPDVLATLVSRVVEILSKPYLVHGAAVDVGASVGSYLAARGEAPGEALERADAAMYEIKHLRRVDFG